MRPTIFCSKSRSASSSMSLQGVAAKHAGALTDEVLELGAAELMVEPGLHHADELGDGHLTPAQPILGHDDAGEPGDQRAVEIEEGTDLGAGRAGPRSRRPIQAAASSVDSADRWPKSLRCTSVG